MACPLKTHITYFLIYHHIFFSQISFPHFANAMILGIFFEDFWNVVGMIIGLAGIDRELASCTKTSFKRFLAISTLFPLELESPSEYLLFVTTFIVSFIHTRLYCMLGASCMLEFFWPEDLEYWSPLWWSSNLLLLACILCTRNNIIRISSSFTYLFLRQLIIGLGRSWTTDISVAEFLPFHANRWYPFELPWDRKGQHAFNFKTDMLS